MKTNYIGYIIQYEYNSISFIYTGPLILQKKPCFPCGTLYIHEFPKPSGLAILENSGTGTSGRLNLLHIGVEINMTVKRLTPGDACTITSEKNTRMYKNQQYEIIAWYIKCSLISLWSEIWNRQRWHILTKKTHQHTTTSTSSRNSILIPSNINMLLWYSLKMQIRNSQTVRNLGCVKPIKLGVQWPILNHHPSAHAEPSDEAQGIVHRRSSVRNLVSSVYPVHT